MAEAKEIGDNQHATARIAPLDKAGNPAQVEAGKTTWAVSDPALAVIDSFDDTSAVVRDLGPLGEYDLTVSADADLGEGVTTITDSIHITVVAGPATNLGLSLDTPADNT